MQALIVAYEAGVPVNELAVQFGVHRATVLARVAARGVARRNPRTGLPERINEAASLYVGGATLAEVGRQLGVSEETVRVHLHRAGVPIRPRGSRSGS